MSRAKLGDEANSKEQSGVPLLLLSEQEAAVALGVSHRKFQELRGQDWCPKPIVLGPRLLRWSRAELEAAVASMPRQTSKAESLREQIERMKCAQGDVR